MMAMPNPESQGAKPSDSGPAPSLTSSQPAPKPLLASEALREDLAPVEPWKSAMRVWATVLGAMLAATMAVPLLLLNQAGPAAWLPYVLTGGVAVLAGLVPLPYTLRAVLVMLVAVACGVLGISGLGPEGALSKTLGEWSMLHLLAATGLPAALLFRARYRAYPGARHILAIALALALPFVGYCVMGMSTGPIGVQVTSGIAVAAVAVTLIGFMGSETTVYGNWIAATVIAAVSAQLASEAMTPLWPPQIDAQLWWVATSLAAFAFASILGALGVFQLLARRHWQQAGTVDVTRVRTGRPSLPSLGDSWASRR